jgi:hypothetical protein
VRGARNIKETMHLADKRIIERRYSSKVEAREPKVLFIRLPYHHPTGLLSRTSSLAKANVRAKGIPLVNKLKCL